MILSVPQDTHAHAMCEAIERKGGEVAVYYTTDFPQRLGLTIRPGRRSAALATHDPLRRELGGEWSAVWLRRTWFSTAPAAFEESDRAIVERADRGRGASARLTVVSGQGLDTAGGGGSFDGSHRDSCCSITRDPVRCGEDGEKQCEYQNDPDDLGERIQITQYDECSPPGDHPKYVEINARATLAKFSLPAISLSATSAAHMLGPEVTGTFESYCCTDWSSMGNWQTSRPGALQPKK
jgi:hypothetical protein